MILKSKKVAFFLSSRGSTLPENQGRKMLTVCGQQSRRSGHARESKRYRLCLSLGLFQDGAI